MRSFRFKLSKSFLLSFGFISVIILWKFIKPWDPKASFVSQPPVDIASKEFTSKVEAFFAAGNESLGFSGYVMVSQGEVVWQKGYGKIAPDQDILPSSTSPFRLGSITKPILALAVLEAESKGRLSIQDAVCKYLACFCEPAKKSILIKDLLNHTSGLPHDFDSAFSAIKYSLHYQFQPKSETAPFWAQVLCNAPIDESTRARSSYSNLGYQALGQILEDLEKRDLQEILQQNIFARAEMNSTLLDSTDNVVGAPVGMQARQALWSRELYLKKDLEINYSSLGGAGAVISTAEDLFKFLNVIEARQLFHSLNWDFYLGNIQTGDASIWVNEATGNQKTIRWHNGSTAGFYSFVAMIPETQTRIIMLSNIQRRSSQDIQQFFSELNSMVSEKPYKIPVK